MGLANYGELQASIAAWATKTSLTAQIPDFVAWAHQEIGRRLRCPLLYARADVTVGAESVAAPAGFLAAKRFFLDLTPRRQLRLVDSATAIDMSCSQGTGDYPSVFAVEGTDTLAFAPLFGGSTTGKLLFYKAPDLLVDDADSNVVLAKYPFLYLWGALQALFRYLEDDNNAAIYGGQFDQLIASINAEEARDALRGPIYAGAGTAVV